MFSPLRLRSRILPYGESRKMNGIPRTPYFFIAVFSVSIIKIYPLIFKMYSK